MDYSAEKLKFIEELIKLSERYTVDEIETSGVRIKKTLFYNVDHDNYQPLTEIDEESLLFNSNT